MEKKRLNALKKADSSGPADSPKDKGKTGWYTDADEYTESRKREKEEKREKEWVEYWRIKKNNEKAMQLAAENRGHYTKAKTDDKVYCIKCGQPFHKGCMKAIREQQGGDKCPMCRQDMFEIKLSRKREEEKKKERKWLENILLWTPIELIIPGRRKEEEEGCPICLLSWDDCDINVGRWGDDIIVETRTQRWLRRWRQRAITLRERLGNTRCTVMGGKRKKKKKRKTRKKKRKKKTKRKKRRKRKKKTKLSLIHI